MQNFIMITQKKKKMFPLACERIGVLILDL